MIDPTINYLEYYGIDLQEDVYQKGKYFVRTWNTSMDIEFNQIIRREGDWKNHTYTTEQIAERIREEIHLHFVVKANLLMNLEMIHQTDFSTGWCSPLPEETIGEGNHRLLVVELNKEEAA